MTVRVQVALAVAAFATLLAAATALAWLLVGWWALLLLVFVGVFFAAYTLDRLTDGR